MVRGRVVGDEVHQEPEVYFPQMLVQVDEVGLRTEVPMQGVARDREGRAAASASVKPGSVAWNSCSQSLAAQRHLAAGRAGLPEAQEPDVVEAQGDYLIKRGIGEIGQGSRTPKVSASSRSHTRVFIW